METRVASLLVRATDLQRKIYSSLPWGYRFARLFVAISGATKAAWAQAVGLIMVRAGVTDMPPLPPGFNPKDPQAKLPKDFITKAGLDDLADLCFGMLLKAIGNEADADDIYQDVLLPFYAKPAKMKAETLSAAKSFIRGAVDLKIKEYRKKIKRRRETGMPMDEEGEEIELVDDPTQRNPHLLDNPGQFKTIKDTVPEAYWKGTILPAVGRIHKDMPFFLALLAQGGNEKKIVLDDVLPNWGTTPGPGGEGYYNLADPAQARSALSGWNQKVVRAREVIVKKIREYYEMNN